MNKPTCLSNLSESLHARFKCLGDLSDLANAISCETKVVVLTDGRDPEKPTHLSNLGITQLSHFHQLGDLSDLENAISNQTEAVKLIADRHHLKHCALQSWCLPEQLLPSTW